MKKIIYLDYAAATPLEPKVFAAMEPYLKTDFYNPSATYLAARKIRRKLEEARGKMAKALGSKPAEIIFTAGATEANNLAIQGIMRAHPEGEILISAVEHESVLRPAKLFKSKKIPVNQQGIVDLVAFKKLITDKTVLVCVMLVNNEIGSVQPIKEIATILRQIRSQRSEKDIKMPIYLHADAAQAPCYLDSHVSRLGIDLMSINGGKIYGPKQSGALYVRAGLKLQPLILGGGQEGGLRSGTENVAGCVGLAQALVMAVELKQAEAKRVAGLKQEFIKGLEKIHGAAINGFPKHSTPHILSVAFAGVDNEKLMMQLDEAGAQAAVGSACSASSREPSHVLKAIGLNADTARSSLRFSFGRATSRKDIIETLKLLEKFTAG